jgi:hypothetical protein
VLWRAGRSLSGPEACSAASNRRTWSRRAVGQALDKQTRDVCIGLMPHETCSCPLHSGRSPLTGPPLWNTLPLCPLLPHQELLDPQAQAGPVLSSAACHCDQVTPSLHITGRDDGVYDLSSSLSGSEHKLLGQGIIMGGGMGRQMGGRKEG